MIYTVTLNPSIDYTMHVSHLETGKTNRSSNETFFPGGKGLNVSMILTDLGMETLALGFCAGPIGNYIESLLSQRNLNHQLIHLDNGCSRINIKIKSEIETEINGNGPHIQASDVERLMQKLDTLKEDDFLVLAGSIPHSVPNNIYEMIMQRLNHRGVRFVVDATGPLLQNTLTYHPFLIKPNRDELSELFNVDISTADELTLYARKLREMGAQNVLVSLGDQGAILINELNEVFFCPAAMGELKNSVGSGDSMIAGFLTGYLQTHDYAYALKLGSACGAATAFSDDLANLNLIKQIEKELIVHKIA